MSGGEAGGPGRVPGSHGHHLAARVLSHRGGELARRSRRSRECPSEAAERSGDRPRPRQALGSSSSLPLVRRAGQVLVRLAHLGHGVGPAHLRHELAAHRAGEEVGQRLLHHVAPAEAVHEPEAHHRAALAHQPARAQVVLLAPGDAVDHDPAEGRQRLDRRVEHPPARHLQHHVHLAAAVGLEDRRRQVLGLRVHRRVRAQLQRLVAPLRGARGGDHAARPEGLGQLHGEASHAARPGDHHHALPGAELGRGPVQVPGGEALDQQRQGGTVLQAVGDGEGLVGTRHGLLGVPPGAQQGDHPPPARVGARHLAAEHQWKVVLRDVAVLALVDVGEVQPGAWTRPPAARPLPARAWAGPPGFSTSGPPNSSIWTARIAPQDYEAVVGTALASAVSAATRDAIRRVASIR